MAQILAFRGIEVFALSGDPAEVQNRCNQVIAAGGGTVYIPEGDLGWPELSGGTVRINLASLPDGAWLRIIGSYNNVTALTNYGDSKTMPATIIRGTSAESWGGFFFVQGAAGRHIRFSGISFLGIVPDYTVETATYAIHPKQVDGFRIDHCFFDSFDTSEIHIHGSKGLIDHCDFDQTFCLHQIVPKNQVSWGYCIGVYGDSQLGGTWTPSLDSLLGKWDTGLSYTAGPIYIEDCTFRNGRHAISSAQFGYYVVRHNQFLDYRSSSMPYVDIHGKPYPAGRGAEIYDNDFYGAMPIHLRGGGGVAFNNRFNNFPFAIQLFCEGYDAGDPNNPQYPTDIWIWGNTYINVATQINNVDPDKIILNSDYFLTSKPNYVPFQYPHPLTMEEQPPTGPTTPFLSLLEEAAYRISMPPTVTTPTPTGNVTYAFKQWENGSTNPERTINLTADTAITAVYELVEAPPTPPIAIIPVVSTTAGLILTGIALS